MDLILTAHKMRIYPNREYYPRISNERFYSVMNKC